MLIKKCTANWRKQALRWLREAAPPSTPQDEGSMAGFRSTWFDFMSLNSQNNLQKYPPPSKVTENKLRETGLPAQVMLRLKD